jgi:hypothetical protein
MIGTTDYSGNAAHNFLVLAVNPKAYSLPAVANETTMISFN